MTEKEYIEVCPVCGSSHWYYESGGYTGKLYHCKNCGYIGPLIVEANQEMIDAIKQDYKRKKESEEGS
ncbi:hypothetical protein [Methanohalobium sp.]|uniref:hypothetical protein n=1 Tax=Methanohalobium sp. TaxID=2837493 RepID=UPI0025CFEEEE|nr:hypothetical protein [Methanohalobium sp.]